METLILIGFAILFLIIGFLFGRIYEQVRQARRNNTEFVQLPMGKPNVPRGATRGHKRRRK
jgi:uncharacterized membrane protein affecting hemolysin expression